MELSLILPTGEVAAFVKPRAPSSSELPCESRGSLAPTPALFSGVGPPIGVVLAASRLCGWRGGGTHRQRLSSSKYIFLAGKRIRR